jgi:hypothetical protein
MRGGILNHLPPVLPVCATRQTSLRQSYRFTDFPGLQVIHDYRQDQFG